MALNGDRALSCCQARNGIMHMECRCVKRQIDHVTCRSILKFLKSLCFAAGTDRKLLQDVPKECGTVKSQLAQLKSLYSSVCGGSTGRKLLQDCGTIGGQISKAEDLVCSICGC